MTIQKQRISLPSNLLFHISTNHIDQMLEFRLWVIARYILDHKKCGTCNKSELIRFAKIKPETLNKVLRHSELFRGHSKNTVYYVSQLKVAQMHKLKLRTKFRLENLSKNYIGKFRDQRKFKAYIVKCYFENDLSKKYKQYTNGLISNDQAAKAFKLSKRTIQRLLRLSGAKSNENIKEFKNVIVDIQYQWRFGRWLVTHAGERLDGRVIGNDSVMNNNFGSYFVRRNHKNKFYLCQQLPQIFRFTGVQLKTGIITGNGSPTHTRIQNNVCC